MPLTQSHYILGNSLVNYAEGGPYSNVPVWLDLFAESAQNAYAASGRYGFLRDFADADQFTSQWGFAGVDSSFDGTAFDEATLDVVVITPANFIQGNTPDSDYAGDTRSPLDATLDVLAEVTTAQPEARVLIYEGWADMGPFADDVPAEGDALAAYHAYNQEEYHAWYVSLVDALNASDPDAEVRLLPVGSLLSDLLTGPLSSIPPSELYVDIAPHGTDTLYFLSAMITYQASYGSAPPLPDSLPAQIHPTVLAEFDAINAAIAEGLDGFDLEVTEWDVLEGDIPVPDPELEDIPPSGDQPDSPVAGEDPSTPDDEAAEDDPDTPADPVDQAAAEDPPAPVASPAADPRPETGESDPGDAPALPAPAAGYAARYFEVGAGVTSLDEVDFTAPPDSTERVDTPQHIHSDAEIGLGTGADHVAASYTQDLTSDTGGVFRLNLQADDHAQVWIDGTLVLDSAEAPLETLLTAEVALAPGSHAIEVRYLEVSGDATLLYDMTQTATLGEDETDSDLTGEAVLSLLSRTADDQGFSAQYEVVREAEEPEDSTEAVA